MRCMHAFAPLLVAAVAPGTRGDSGSSSATSCTGIADGSKCDLDGSNNYHNATMVFHKQTGKFTGTVVTNLCSQNHYGYCALCTPPAYVDHQHTASCTQQQFPAPAYTSGPNEAPLRGRVGLTVQGVNIYGPMEAGFGIGNNPKPCTDGTGTCDAGLDVPTCEYSLDVTCGGSSKVQHSLMLDTCGGHAMPYHYHNDMACDYNHTQPGHSPLIGWALDGYGIYGLYEDHPTKPTDLDACNGHVHTVPVNAEFGVPLVSVYHYHTTSSAPYTIGCFGTPDGVTQAKCKTLYNTSSGQTGKCNDGTVRIKTPDVTSGYCYDLDCPCYDGRTDAIGRNTDATDC